MEDILYFLREKRAGLLIGGGLVIAFLWLIATINYRLFELSAFGELGLSVGWASVIFVPVAVILLFLTYWAGSENSPVYNTAPYGIARFIYITFKNCMVILAIITMVVGLPRMKYYQERASDNPGLEELSYYEQRTIFNVFNSGVRVMDGVSDYNEAPDPHISESGTSSDSDSSSSSKSKSSSDDGWGGLLEALASALVLLLVFLLVLFYFAIVFMAFVFPNFWIVSIICIAVGMVCLGIIDIMDGPQV